MSAITVCLIADTIGYPTGGGHLWAYLNWALGLRSAGCRVLWLEGIGPRHPPDAVRTLTAALRERLARYGLGQSLAVFRRGSGAGGPPDGAGEAALERAAEAADLLLNLAYATPADVVGRFRRSALVDIDPGLLQLWLHRRQIAIAPHDVYFTTGETVGRPGSRIPDCGLRWHHTPPPVALDAWPAVPPRREAAFTTVSHWQCDEWVEEGGETYCNDKRTGFLPFLDLPSRCGQPLELALCLAADEEDERARLVARGWSVRRAEEVAGSPWDYQRYVQGSRGEFSCAKPSCLRLQNAWVSDRTLCYLASGRPAVVQHTGPSRILPDEGGLFRFRTAAEASRDLERASSDLDHQSRLARQLAEARFDAAQVAARVLELSL
jgi:hypothetical protein